MSDLKFVDTHNLVAFLKKPTESEGFEEIDNVKEKTINGEVQLQALVDKKKVIITESTIRRDLQLEDAEGTECLPTATIFEELTRMGYEKLTQKLTFYKAFFSPQWKFLIHTILQCLSAKTTAWNEFSSTMASAIICLATNQNFNFSKYIFDNMVKNVDSMVQFWMYPRFVQVFMNKQVGDMSHHKRIFVTPSHTKKIFGNMKREGKGFSGRKKQSRRKQRKDTEIPQSSGPIEHIADEVANEEHVPTQSNDPPLSRVNTLRSGEDRLSLKELMDLCTKLSDRVLDINITKTAQAKEIASLKKRVKKMKRKRKSKTPRMKRLFKIGRFAQVVSSEDEGLGDQEDAFKQGRKILDIDADEDITLNSTHVNTDPDMFGVHDLHGDEVFVEIEEHVVNATTTTTTTATTTVADEVEMTLAQTLIKIKSVKGQGSKDKGKEKMIEPEKLLKKTDQVLFDEQEAIRLQAQFDVEARVAREKEEANAQLLEKRRKFFAAKRAEEKRNKRPTKAQQQSIMCTYLKNMEGWKPKDLKTKSFANVQELFDKAMIRVNTFVDFRTELVEGTKREESSKRDETIGQESSSKRAVISDEEGVTIDVIPLSTKPPSIVDYKIIKEGKISIYQIIRADGSSKRYSAVIHMLKNFNREDLETLWKIVKARHGYTRPEEGYGRVLWGDLKTVFEHHVEDLMWRVNIGGTKLQLLKDCNCSRIKIAEKLMDEQLWNYYLLEIQELSNITGRSLTVSQYLLRPNPKFVTNMGNRLFREALDFDMNKSKIEHQQLHSLLNPEQRLIYKEVMESVNNKKGQFYFVYRPRGTGKTFLYKTIISRLRSERMIILAVASSGIDSLLLPGGRTAHTRFVIPLKLMKNSTCGIKQNTHLAELMQQVQLFI
ncbi:putative ribonuclease H-like domain-containing protein [Tanacetum coccineum]